MGPRCHRTLCCAVAATLLALLATGCSTTDTGREGPGATNASRRGSGAKDFDLGRILPEPLGSVTFKDDPVIFVLGWTGMIAGGAVGLVFTAVHDDSSGSGSGEILVAGTLLGAVLGGCILTAPVKGIEELWKWLFHPRGRHPEPVPEAGPGDDGP